MLILGLLAAIAIPAFFNQRTKAQDSEAKSTSKTAQTALETYATDNNGSYASRHPRESEDDRADAFERGQRREHDHDADHHLELVHDHRYLGFG